MKKIVVLVFGFLMSLSASAVKVHELSGISNQKVYEGLLKGSEEAATEMQNMSVKSAEFSTNYVERFKNGTISRWRLIDKRTRKTVDYWYSRNGLDVPSEEASMVEHFTKNSLGNEFTVQRPMFARRKAHFETSIPEPLTGADVTNDVKRFSDAEIKAIQRGFRTKRELGLSSENLILEGYVDKPNCPVCSLNLTQVYLGPCAYGDLGLTATNMRSLHG